MKKKTCIIIASVLIIATFCVLLTGCSKTGYVKNSDITALTENNTGFTDGTAYKIPVEDAKLLDYWSGEDLVLLSVTKTENDVSYVEYCVVSGSEGKIVYSGKDRPYITKTDSGSLVWGDVYYVVSENLAGEDVATFYSVAGAIVENVPCEGFASGTGKIKANNYSEGNLDLGNGKIIQKQGDSYVVKDKEYFTVNAYSEDETSELESYRLHYLSYTESFVIADKDTGMPVKTVTMNEILGTQSSDVGNREFVILPENKILVQEITVLPENTTKNYDFYNAGNYYTLKTAVYDVEKGKTKEIKDCKYVFNGYGEYIKDAGITVCNVSQIIDEKLCTVGLQGFDADLNEAFDIQSMLPMAKNWMCYGDYIAFTNGDVTVIYKGDTKILEYNEDKINVTTSYLFDSDILVSLDKKAVFNYDGTLIATLESLGADSFEYLDYAKNYIYYVKTDKDATTGKKVQNLYAYDRSTGTSSLVADYDSSIDVGYGYLAIADRENDDAYGVVDLMFNKKIIDSKYSYAINIISLEDTYLIFCLEKESLDSEFYICQRK